MKSIWMRLALIFMAVSASGILISTILSLKEMDYHFSLYLSDVNQKHKQDLVSLLQEEYKKEHGWENGSMLKLEAASLLLGQQITLYDRDGQFIRTFEETKSAAFSNLSEDMIPITDQGELLGYIGIRYDNAGVISLEEHFQIAHTNAMQWTMLALLLIVCLVSIFTAKRFAKPIVMMSDAAMDVSKGNLAVRVVVPRGKDELSSLVETFNQLIQSLQNQEDLRKRLTSDIAHELRTPLNTLLAQTEGMIDGIWEATPEHLEATRSEVLRLIRIVSDLDQVIQAEAGALSISRDAVDLSKVVASTLDAMNTVFQQKEISLTSSIHPASWIVGDEQRLAQVFSNLLTNSLKHTSKGGEVMVSVINKGEFIEVNVTDNGRGISHKDLPFVFERFYRGDRSRNRESGGIGLGLTIVKGIVEAHQGEVQINSNEGKGTTVTVSFPARKE
ncbi:ATP-binding protein [Brevibacillus centrosporus]|uniref:sensor histidine kinase n=1 Tax=Brevibacillus centrosporus TaxID=54910 RepID=UPI0011417353|nr:ATP-binding protein [Brevibacillus centrosporus]MEC2130056.1 ATP-binding protein [Brevibacillus centrosporus]GED32437.1 two-component sensor histidine kinase [Brevibacillus centrosporus]